jgi:BirA family biotin operon repressor/biotin-[acetyl-CoA-carboxylase] ligase
MFNLKRFEENRRGRFGAPFLFFETIASTNAIAVEKAREKIAEGTVIFADCQTSGRGRGNHSWFSPSGVNIYASMILYPSEERLHHLPFLTAVALSQTLEQWGIKCDLKWPNDILYREKKLGGILIQTSTEESRLQFAVVGVGVNLNVESFPPDLQQIAVSGFQVIGRKIDREAFLAAFLWNLEQMYREGHSWDQLAVLFADRSSYVRDCEVDVDLGDRHIKGRSAGLDRTGGLILQTLTGYETIHAGEIFSCRKK